MYSAAQATQHPLGFVFIGRLTQNQFSIYHCCIRGNHNYIFRRVSSRKNLSGRSLPFTRRQA
jgi:hypothetical protein